MKRVHKQFLFWVVLSVVILIVGSDLLHFGFPYTHDGENHLARFANYKIALKEGQFPPRFAPNLFNHYGYPVLNYNYPLANIISVPFSVLGLNYELTYKLIVFLALIAAGIGGSLWLQMLGVKQKSVLLVSIAAWLSLPYVSSLIIFRGSIGELLAFSLLPSILCSMEHWFQKKSSITPTLSLLHVVPWTLFFLSHNSTVLIATPVLLSLLLIRSKILHAEKRHLYTYLFFVIIALLLTLWFWMPALLEKNEVLLSSSQNQSDYSNHFVTTKQLFFSAHEFGYSYPGGIDSISLGIGLSSVFAILGSVIMIIATGNTPSNAKQNHWWVLHILPFLLVSLITIVLQHEVSSSLWKHISLLRYVQFPWRFGLLTAAFSLPLIASVLMLSSGVFKKLFLCLVVFQIYLTFMARPVDYFHRQTIDYDFFSQSTSTQNENLPQSFRYLNVGDWQPKPAIIEGEGESDVTHWTGSQRTYLISIIKKSVVVEPTMRFLGWQTNIKDVKTNNIRRAEYIDSDVIAGRISFILEPGEYEISSRFTQRTVARTLGNGVSLITAGLYLIYIAYSKYAIKK